MEEIGTRKAFGAKRRGLLLQFIVESLTLSTSGGAIGLLLGVLIARAVSNFGGWTTSIEAPALITAFTFFCLGRTGSRCVSCHASGQALSYE